MSDQSMKYLAKVVRATKLCEQAWQQAGGRANDRTDQMEKELNEAVAEGDDFIKSSGSVEPMMHDETVVNVVEAAKKLAKAVARKASLANKLERETKAFLEALTAYEAAIAPPRAEEEDAEAAEGEEELAVESEGGEA